MKKTNLRKTLVGLSWRLFFLSFALIAMLVIYLDSVVRDEFKQNAWQIPAKVYARPLSFSLGATLATADLIDELALLGYRKTIKAVNQGEYEVYRDGDKDILVIHTRGFQFWDGLQPPQLLELEIDQGKIVKLLDFASQKQVNFLRLDPLVLGSINAKTSPSGAEDRQLISLQQLPEHFVPLLLNTEDRDFYQHWGISIKGIARAVLSNLSAGSIRQGGSTLTQQLMKNHFLSSEKTLWRKFKEAIMAILTEVHYDKDAILQAYINEIYLGQNHQVAIHGFARASEFYFDLPVEELSLSQAALLVGMVKGPSLYNPRKNPQAALQRRDLVLTQMYENGLLGEEDYQEAKRDTLQVVKRARFKPSQLPAFMSYLRRELQQDYSLSQIHQDGLKLFTSLDPVIQAKAENSLREGLKLLENQPVNPTKELQGAVLVSDVHTGDLLAMVGDRQADYHGFNRALDAYRQTGSLIKPFVYYTALRQSGTFNLLTQLEDSEFSLSGDDGSQWTPQNYDRISHGRVSLQDALVNSYNQATARLALTLGVEALVKTLQQAGFERDIAPLPSLALGTKEMSPLEVLQLYQVIANQGVSVNPKGLLAVQDHQSQLLQRYPRQAEKKLDPETSFLLQYLLTQVAERGTAKSLKQRFPGKVLAGKTGTTNDLRDSWFAGFGGKHLAVVWLGRDDNQPTQLSGATGALLVWQDLFSQLSEPSVELQKPDGLVWAQKNTSLFSRFSSCEPEHSLPLFPTQVAEGYRVCH